MLQRSAQTRSHLQSQMKQYWCNMFGLSDLGFHLSFLGPLWHFQHENCSHHLEFCCKVPRRCTPIFLVAKCSWFLCWHKCASGRFNLVVTATCFVVSKTMSHIGESISMVDLGVSEGWLRNDCNYSCDCFLFLLMLVRRHWVRLGSLFCLPWVQLLLLDNWRVPRFMAAVAKFTGPLRNVVHQPINSSVCFLQILLTFLSIFAPWNAGSQPEEKLPQASILVQDRLEVHADLG